jgi:hypothetical protein
MFSFYVTQVCNAHWHIAHTVQSCMYSILRDRLENTTIYKYYTVKIQYSKTISIQPCNLRDRHETTTICKYYMYSKNTVQHTL